MNIREVALHDTQVCLFCAEEAEELGDGGVEDVVVGTGSSCYPGTSEEEELREKIKEGLLIVASPAVIHFRPRLRTYASQ